MLALAVFGTVELWTVQGAGAGEGPQPIWKPNSSNILQVQVIGQQWAWTYRTRSSAGSRPPSSSCRWARPCSST